MARVVLVVQPTSNGVSLIWSDGPAAFSSYELTRKTLTTAADAARAELGSVVESVFSGQPGDVAAASAKLAQAGYGLYQALFKPGAEQFATATEIRKWLDKLQSQGAVETVEVVADGVDPVPWNLVYDHKPDPAAFQTGGTDPARWQPFWGLRYDLAGGRRVSPLRRFPVLHDPRVVVVTDPMVIDNLPTESRELTALCRENSWPLARSRTELAEVMQAGRPDILYWLGHTQTDPFGLVLGDDVITPDELRALMEGNSFGDTAEVFGGVAFLNACGTATGDKSGSFLDALHPLGLSGYVVTEQSTVDTFAAPLGREFLSAFVVRGEPLGQVMRHLRGQVPLGLIYGSYCPSVLHVRQGSQGQPAAGESVAVVLTVAAGGTKLGRSAVAPTVRSPPLPAHPYRSLRSYGPADRALFAGREDDVLRFTQVLDDPGTRLLILHGESGVGKTSFLRAGVMPYLEHDCVGYRFARDRSSDEGDSILLVRATNDLVSQIAAALTAYGAQPLTYRTPLGEDVSADLSSVIRSALGGGEGHDVLRDAFRLDPSLLGRLLVDLSRKLPFTPVLVIDQAEEVFTLARTPTDEENRAQALEMLRRAASGPVGFKIVVSLRTEYHGRFTDRLRKGTRDAGGVREFLLTDFGLDALIEVIRRPTLPTRIEHAVEIPAEKYGFRYADGVADEIARRTRAYTINRQDSVLPLVQVLCTQLYDLAKARPDGVITLIDLDAIGGVEGGMRAHAEGVVRRLFPQRVDQKAFKRLLGGETTQLYIRQSDGTLTTALLSAEFLALHWSGRMPFEEVLQRAGDGDWRVLRVNSLRIGADEKERAYVSLGHDALAKVAAGWHEEQKRRAQIRKYAAALVVMAAVVGVLAGLTGWALDQRESAKLAAKRADDSALEANDERDKAKSAKATADSERDKAESAKAVADDERDKANRAKATAESERLKALRLHGLTYASDGLKLVEEGQISFGMLKMTHALVVASDSPEAAAMARAQFDLHRRYWRPAYTLTQLFSHPSSITSVAFSPDGWRVVTGSQDGTAQVWDAATGKAISPPLQHKWWVLSVAFSQDGRRVLTGSLDRTAHVWDASTGKAVSPPLQLTGEVKSMAFSPDGRRILIGSDDNTARVWDAATGKALSPPLQHNGWVLSVAFSSDGQRVLTGCWDNTARVWDAVTGKALSPPLQHDGWVQSVAFSPDGRRVVTGCRDGTARLWDADTGKALSPPLKLAGPVESVAFSPDGRRVLTGSTDKTARVWDAATGKALSPPLQHSGPVMSVAFNPDGRRVLTGSTDQTARMWEADNGNAVSKPLTQLGAVQSVAFSPDGRRVLTGSRDKAARVWNANNGKALSPPLQHAGEVNSVAFSQDGQRVLTGSRDKTARVWDADTGKALSPPLQHAGEVISVAFSQDGRRVLTGSQDKTAQQWDANTGKALALPLQHSGPVRSVAFSRDGRRILTVSDPNTTRVWDADTGKALSPPLEYAVPVGSVALSPDGQRILTANLDDTGRVWDAETGKALSPPLQHGSIVSSVAFSPDGRRVLTGSYDTTARVWDADTGKALSPPLQHADLVISVAFSPDGRRVLTWSQHGSIWVWDMTPDERPIADIVGLAQLWSAHRIDDTGSLVPLTVDEQSRLWTELRAKYPDEFTVSPQSVRRWREGEIRDCMKEGNIRAAKFHYWALFAELASGKARQLGLGPQRRVCTPMTAEPRGQSSCRLQSRKTNSDEAYSFVSSLQIFRNDVPGHGETLESDVCAAACPMVARDWEVLAWPGSFWLFSPHRTGSA